MNALARAVPLLEGRVAELESRVRQGDERAWPAYLRALEALAAVAAQAVPGNRGELLTTREMAERLAITPKTLLKHKRRGTVKPAVQRGKLIRWYGNEAAR